jgi:excisionase family DNA binding protein
MSQQESAAVPAEPMFYSVATLARVTGMSKMTLYRAIAAGEFPAIRVRGRLIIPARALEAMIEAATADRTIVDAAGWAPEGATR